VIGLAETGFVEEVVGVPIVLVVLVVAGFVVL